MTSTVVRTRFAPSPTGYLHIGSARTALYCWLYAQKMQGTFILRIEDTDLERSTPESVQAILDGMAWLNLDYAEGPFYQTARFPRYQEVLDDMLTRGLAYRCYCSKERLETLREDQMQRKEKPRYDGHCRSLTTSQADTPYVIRFKNPDTGVVQFEDLVRGVLTVANAELDDLIIARSDGTPTYNFCVVVDDWDMQITHVIRGDDHINNTPRQINILQALDASLPQYAHIPMILGSDGKRLSKRHGAVGVMQYAEDGFLPQALLNYLVRLGWSHGDQEIFTTDEMINFFSFDHVNHAPAAINVEKLLWVNQHYLKTLPPHEIVPQLATQFDLLQIDTRNGPDLADVILLQRDRTKTLREMAERSRYFYEEVTVSNLQIDAIILPLLRECLSAWRQLSEWQAITIHQVLTAVATQHDVKLGKLAQPLRQIITGGTVSPSLDATLALLGQVKTIARMEKVLLPT